MNYPLISEYIEAIKSPEDNFDLLVNLRPVLDNNGNPIMSSGNFAVVFRMTDGKKDFAIKCFTRDQEGRDDSYRKIADELEHVNISYLCPIRYFEKELFVDSVGCTESEFPILQMEWVDGIVLDNYIRNNLYNTYALENLTYQFCRMAQWLITQPFAHGDLKPDNVLVKNDGSLVLVDYDGMFVPTMRGEKARELGSPNYRHPMRMSDQFDEHIDDFALASIAVSLQAIALNPELYSEYSSADRFLFSDIDFQNLGESKLVSALQTLMGNPEFQKLYGLFLIAFSEQSLAKVSFKLFEIARPIKLFFPENLSTEVTEEELADGVEDEYGVKYSKDGRKLLKANQCLDIHEYRVKEGTLIICDGALQNDFICLNPHKITLPESVIAIGAYAFAYNEELEYINIPKYVRYMQSNNPFVGCFKLQTIDIQTKYLFTENNFLLRFDRKILYSCIRTPLEEHIKIPEGVETISVNSFWNVRYSSMFCKYKYISIPKSVTSISKSAFSGCKPLHSIIIPDWVKSIDDSAFAECDNLQSITIPNSVTSIGDCAFAECVSLQSISIPISVTSIGDGTFINCGSLSSITIPDSVMNIGDYAFSGCGSLQSITLPGSVMSIGHGAFSGCVSLRNITIPDSVTNIGNSTFYRCESLQSITIPDSVTRIGDNAFYRCRTLQSIIIPDSVTSIGDYAFDGCSSLQSITVPESVTSIGDSAFSGCKSLQSISIPESMTNLGVCTFSGCESLQSITIPDSVTSIDDYAFSGCESLQSITIPDSVTNIGKGAFHWCESLLSIIIPKSVTLIGGGAFNGCNNINLKIQTTNYICNRDCLIDNRTNKIISCLRNDLETYVITDSVTSIDEQAFDSCKSLKTIFIPDSVISIDKYAFNCCESLQYIYIPRNTKTKFEKLLPEYRDKLVELY